MPKDTTTQKRKTSRTSSNATSSSSTRPPSPPPPVDLEKLIESLNTAQREAVLHDPDIPLQILAGPGSGKTKVLTSRIVQLIVGLSMDPASICAVTFTNKAANEMRIRLTKVLGKQRTDALKLGTFHSICARFLRTSASKVGLDPNFTVCDADDSKKLIGALIKPYKDQMEDQDIAFTESSVASAVSKAKAKGISSAEHLADTLKEERKKPRPDGPESKSAARIIAEIYVGYEKVLKDNNALDFDDLLVYGVKLFSKHKESVLWCQHILVDEFQDTNTMQYELMRSIGIRKRVTIVGDPDQSIYGWRSAEVTNLANMRKDFPNTRQIFLEENYRSTGAILRACLAIVAEDKTRIPKSLRTSHPLGPNPVLGCFQDEKEEAAFIAFEIKRTSANMGGILKWGDFVILLRFNALSRPIESALQKQGIPCRILGGHKFFERMEIKDILAYLQLVDNGSFNPAFLRAIKAPSRGVGDKTLSELSTEAEKRGISQYEIVEKIHDGRIPDIKPPIKRKIASFVQTVRTLRKLDAQQTQPSDLIRRLVDLIEYEDHLKKTQQDWESRWENVQELITFANEVETENPVSTLSKTVDEHQSESDGADTASANESLLRKFLQTSMLSSEGDNQSEEESQEKVTLATCHAAKGLEWPVVMIPSVDQDTFPFYRSEDFDEERRLLYVACTRAQSLLYILHSAKRVVAGKTKDKTLSTFVSTPKLKNEALFNYEVPRFEPKDRELISGMLGRPAPDEEEVSRRIAEMEAAGDAIQPAFADSHGNFAAVPLTGVQDKALDPAAVYIDANFLTNLSSTFNKDFRKAPFRKDVITQHSRHQHAGLGAGSFSTGFTSVGNLGMTKGGALRNGASAFFGSAKTTNDERRKPLSKQANPPPVMSSHPPVTKPVSSTSRQTLATGPATGPFTRVSSTSMPPSPLSSWRTPKAPETVPLASTTASHNSVPTFPMDELWGNYDDEDMDWSVPSTSKEVGSVGSVDRDSVAYSASRGLSRPKNASDSNGVPCSRRGNANLPAGGYGSASIKRKESSANGEELGRMRTLGGGGGVAQLREQNSKRAGESHGTDQNRPVAVTGFVGSASSGLPTTGGVGGRAASSVGRVGPDDGMMSSGYSQPKVMTSGLVAAARTPPKRVVESGGNGQGGTAVGGGVKRRLGMAGLSRTGYSNKKFKPPV